MMNDRMKIWERSRRNNWLVISCCFSCSFRFQFVVSLVLIVVMADSSLAVFARSAKSVLVSFHRSVGVSSRKIRLIRLRHVDLWTNFLHKAPNPAAISRDKYETTLSYWSSNVDFHGSASSSEAGYCFILASMWFRNGPRCRRRQLLSLKHGVTYFYVSLEIVNSDRLDYLNYEFYTLNPSALVPSNTDYHR